MGRPSKLTDVQWGTIERRLLAGESTSALAREYGVSKGVISQRFSERVQKVKVVANQLVEADRAFSLLNISEQCAARSLADDLKAISMHLAGAAKFGAMTSHRLSGIAQSKVLEINDATPLDEQSLETLKGIAVLTRMANASSEIGVNLLRANKETVDDINKKAQEAETDNDFNLSVSFVAPPQSVN